MTIDRMGHTNLFIGNANDARSVPHLIQYRIDAVVNVAIDLEDPHFANFRWYKIGLHDGPGNYWFEYVIAARLIMALLAEGKRVLVHCHEGVSRSPAIAALTLAALDHTHPWNIALDYAESRVRKFRTLAVIKQAHRKHLRTAIIYMHNGVLPDDR